MVQPGNRASRHILIAIEPFPGRHLRVVYDRGKNGVIRIRLSNLELEVAISCNTTSPPVHDDDLASWQNHSVWHDSRLGHMFNLPAPGDAFIIQNHTSTL